GGGVGGHVLGTAVNVLASPLQFGAQIGSQVLGEIGSIGSGILHGQGVVGGAIHDIGAGIGNVASSVGSGIAHAGSAILDFLSDARLKRDVRPIAGALALLARVS
ncbi:MAG TPA: hypothetical protein VKE22_22435, partial [Haliangiales bacterium]|nr:hypothetical protein [Haliangiales bacterium]